ncbi:hypothetical protein CDAR_415481 [Caerostris darwini]|uniref:Uncharacterized protein n=1 Tax=Caerostris darwini TaxID=1538125 RepID=A0AAV4MMV4_9ARAC|nr:hypothetical protein CDAR_415481 [Caerostris darwini]
MSPVPEPRIHAEYVDKNERFQNLRYSSNFTSTPSPFDVLADIIVEATSMSQNYGALNYRPKQSMLVYHDLKKHIA